MGKIGKERGVVGRRIGAQASDHALGMPLHAEDGQGLVLQCFDLPVVGVCRRAQAGGEPPDRLMVVAVCLKKAAGQAGDPGAGHCRDRMGDAVMAGNLLEQCAAKKTLMVWMPRQMPSTGLPRAQKARSRANSSVSRRGSRDRRWDARLCP